jgi:NAD+--asparagine ADP-ribosyltransferase
MDAIFLSASDSLVLILELLRIVAVAAKPTIGISSKAKSMELPENIQSDPAINAVKNIGMKTSQRQKLLRPQIRRSL